MENGSSTRNVRWKETAIVQGVPRSCAKDGRCPASGGEWTPNIKSLFIVLRGSVVPNGTLREVRS